MHDWFVLLVPLATLPIVLMFGFVGCGLDRQGAPPEPVILRFGAGFDADIQTLKVTFWFTPENDTTPTISSIEELAVIPPQGGSIDKTEHFKLHFQPRGELHCDCLIGLTAFVLPTAPHLAQKHDPDDGVTTLVFDLIRSDGGFALQLVEEELVYVGGI